MKHVQITCDNCQEKANSEYLEMVVRIESHSKEQHDLMIAKGASTMLPPREIDYTFDIDGVNCIAPKLDPYFNQVMNGDLLNVKVSITRKTNGGSK